jgi:hypothetical protein
MDEEQEDEYTIEDLIIILEDMKKNGEGLLHIPKACLCMAKKIKSLERYLCSYLE